MRLFYHHIFMNSAILHTHSIPKRLQFWSKKIIDIHDDLLEKLTTSFNVCNLKYKANASVEICNL